MSPGRGADGERDALAARIGFVHQGDGRAVSSWSGTPYFMARALERHLGPVVHLKPLPDGAVRLARGLAHVQRRLTGRISLAHCNPLVAAASRREAARKLRSARADIAFAPAASSFASGVPRQIPLIYSSDATFRGVVDSYPEFSNLSRASRRLGERLERAAIARADLLVYPSEWAAESAVRDYGAERSRILVAPFGANLDTLPQAAPSEPRCGGALRLLFVGKEWERKGGDTALEALAALRRMGRAATLTVVGCIPPGAGTVAGLEVAGFLDKADAGQRRRLDGLFANADFLLMPVRAECYGIVFCEAAAHGLPQIATATGGVPSIVEDGVTGRLLPPGSSGEAFAEAIVAAVADREAHAAMRGASRRRSEQVLNWDRWGADVARAARGLLPPARARAAGQGR